MKHKKEKHRKVLIHLAIRRWIHRLRSEKWRREKRLKKQRLKHDNSSMLKIGKSLSSYEEVLNTFLPINLRHIITSEKSPIRLKKCSIPKYTMPLLRITIPSIFSIIENERESYKVLRQIAEALICQTCKHLVIDYRQCKKTDLLTEIYLDAILLDVRKFWNACNKAGVSRFISTEELRGEGYNDVSIRNMVNSVGSPAILIKRKYENADIIPFRLITFNRATASDEKSLNQKEIDSTKLIEYVNSCLQKVNKELSNDSNRELGNVVGEILINAEEHSTLHFRYLVGYFEMNHSSDEDYGVLNLVIMNYGKTIYETFKESDGDVNEKCLNRMKQLSENFRIRSLFDRNFSEENLWTLYSLQQGVTRIKGQKRGDGTVTFIDSFFKLKGDNNIDNKSRMFILSGRSRIEFDGTYRLSKVMDSNGASRNIIAFNDTNSLQDKPNTKYVRSSDYYFPGTAIFACLHIKKEDIKNE